MLTAVESLAVFFGAAVGIDVLLRVWGAWRRCGVLATGADRAIDVQCVEARRAP